LTTVVLTTFGTIASEYKRKETYAQLVESGNAGPKPSLMILGEESKFYRVVIDEAQWIKNKDTQSSKGCWNLNAQYRLCLSGTPMQNSCDEYEGKSIYLLLTLADLSSRLFSLLRFLRIKPYNEWSTFAEVCGIPCHSYVHATYQFADFFSPTQAKVSLFGDSSHG
jgi:hypothetical protein